MALYEYWITGCTQGDNMYGNIYYGQTFTVGTAGDNEAFTLSTIKLRLAKRSGGSPGTVTIDVYAVDGSHKPTGTAISTGTVNGNNLANFTSYGTTAEVSITMSSVILQKSTEYALIVKAPNGSVNNDIYISMIDEAQ